MSETRHNGESKGITAVIGIILLVAVAVILIVIIATFFIGFTSGAGRDLQKSAPSAQVISAAQCDSTAGTVRVANSLTQDIKVGTRAEIKEGTKHYGFVRTTLQAIAAGASAVISFAYEDNADRPFAFKDDKDYTITFVDGPAKTQSFSVKCLAGQEFIKASLDASTDQLCIKATESLDGAGSSATCLTFTPVNTFTQTDISTPQFSAAMPSGKQILGVSSDGSRFFLTDGQPSSNLKTSIDNGANWVAGGDITIPQTGDFSGFFSDSTFEPTKVFALTDGRTTPAVSPSVHSSTDGASWTTVAILTVGQADASTAEDLYFVDATTAYIVGQDSGEGSTKSYIAKTTDSGATWTKIDNLDDGTGTALDVIDIVTLTVSGNTRYVVIGTNTANSKGVIRYSDDALTWIELEITTMTKGLAMELDADGNAIGVFTDGTSIFIFESSNGVDWTQVGSEFGSMDSLAGLYLHKLSGQLYGIIESVGAIIYQGSGVDWTKDTAIGSFMSSSVLGIASAGQTLLVAGGSGADTNVKLAIKNSDTESGGDTFTLFEGGTEKASDATGTTLACLSEDVTSNTIVPTCVSVSLCPTDGSGCSTLDVKRGVGYEFELEQSIDSGAETLVGKIFAGEGQ